MNVRAKVPWPVVISLFVAVIAATPCLAQCYLSQGCAPQDLLNYQPNPATSQVYHGDGASNNGGGGWTTNYSDVNQCLSCHYGTDTYPYLWTGHKNTLRKFAPGTLWGGPDGTLYPTTDGYYGSGSTYDWVNGLVTIGWCDPLATPLQNGVPVNDPQCIYPYYTLPNSHAPAQYTTVPPTQQGGGQRNLFYLKGGWMNYGGMTNPSATQLGTVFDKGHTGQLYPYASYDCARCHATGYTFDHWGPEPTSNTNSKLAWIPDANLLRVPTDGYIAPGTNGTSSWYLTGIQCERCHLAAYPWGSHPYDNIYVTQPQNEQATALCMECHRQETVTMASGNQVGSIAPSSSLTTNDHGYCSDLSGSSYSTCVQNQSNQWVYKPQVDHAQGQEFLNSPHAQFTGNLVQNAQNSADLSVTLAGTYNSYFSEAPSDSTKNYGCVGCHDPHQSTAAGVPQNEAQKPIVNTCDSCHPLAKTILQTTTHPTGPLTPFPTGTQADIPGACITCHMQGALGQAQSHLFRINTNETYYTYPSAEQLYVDNLTGLGTWASVSRYTGLPYNQANWLDVDLACGQCHIGGDSNTNPYGLTPPPGLPGAHAFTRDQLSGMAVGIHGDDPGVPRPTFSPTPTTYTKPVTVTISDTLNGAVIYYTTDGTVPTHSSPVYSSPITITSSTSFQAIGTYPGMPQSDIAYAQYSINLPTAPPPLFSPPPSTYSSTQSVTLSNTASLPMYYTLDGSNPTTNSTPYTGAISVTKDTTIKAIAASYGYLNSPISTGNYYIQAPTPTFSPGSGSYSPPVSVTISDTASGATIYYTADGSIPTTNSTSCPNPCSLSVSTTTTLKAIASGGGYVSSNVATATYTIAAANPVFSPSPGTFYAPLTVTMTDSTPGVLIYYSTTGFPTTSSPHCASPCQVNITTTTTLRAMAAGNGISQSGTTVGVYTLTAQTPTFSPGSGSYASPLAATISDTTPGVTIYYAINGFPTTNSPSCSSPCSISVTGTGSFVVRAMALGNGYSQGGTGVVTYTLH
ncbi:MAG: chitobiase/beta-hexosaminidase C-terminal domain-containing protein [Candidatus Korobacteraceae bacterium]